MKKKSRALNVTRLAIWAAAATMSSQFIGTNAFAITHDAYECSLTGAPSGDLPACPTGALNSGSQTTTNALSGAASCNAAPSANIYCAVKLPASSSAAVPIDTWDVCKWVDNTSLSKDVFVPFKETSEWSGFRDHPPTFLDGAIIQTDCAVPYSHLTHGAPATKNISSGYPACPYTVVGNTPNVYGRTGISLYPATPVPGPSFVCRSSPTGYTSMNFSEQWIAGNVQSPDPGGYSWRDYYHFSPDIDFTPSAASAVTGTQVTLRWVITPYRVGEALSCSYSASPAVPETNWGPDGTGQPLSGSNAVTINNTTLFTINCTEFGVTSVSYATVTMIPPPPPCCSGDGGGDGGLG